MSAKAIIRSDKLRHTTLHISDEMTPFILLPLSYIFGNESILIDIFACTARKHLTTT